MSPRNVRRNPAAISALIRANTLISAAVYQTRTYDAGRGRSILLRRVQPEAILGVEEAVNDAVAAVDALLSPTIESLIEALLNSSDTIGECNRLPQPRYRRHRSPPGRLITATPDCAHAPPRSTLAPFSGSLGGRFAVSPASV